MQVVDANELMRRRADLIARADACHARMLAAEAEGNWLAVLVAAGEMKTLQAEGQTLRAEIESANRDLAAAKGE